MCVLLAYATLPQHQIIWIKIRSSPQLASCRNRQPCSQGHGASQRTHHTRKHACMCISSLNKTQTIVSHPCTQLRPQHLIQAIDGGKQDLQYCWEVRQYIGRQYSFQAP